MSYRHPDRRDDNQIYYLNRHLTDTGGAAQHSCAKLHVERCKLYSEQKAPARGGIAVTYKSVSEFHGNTTVF